MGDPAVLFYTSDFLTGVIDMTMEERGQYITLLCYQHQKGHIKEETIRLLVGYPSDMVMKHFLKDDEGKYYNKRMDFEREKREHFVETRRENGEKGGRPKERKKKPIGKPLGYPKNNLVGNDNDNINNNIYYTNIELDTIFKEYLSLRKKLKAVNSERAIKMLVDKLSKYDDDTKIKMLNKSIVSSWKDVYELKEDKTPTWFNKETNKEEMTKEELAELEESLKEFR